MAKKSIKSGTMRQRVAHSKSRKEPSRRLRVANAGRSARGLLRREYYLPLPDNKIGKFLNQRRYFWPPYFRRAFSELKAVSWPNRRETRQLTVAVFMFALIFGLLAAVVDYGLDKLFKRLLLNT